jgi:hypothetical protein
VAAGPRYASRGDRSVLMRQHKQERGGGYDRETGSDRSGHHGVRPDRAGDGPESCCAASQQQSQRDRQQRRSSAAGLERAEREAHRRPRAGGLQLVRDEDLEVVAGAAADERAEPWRQPHVPDADHAGDPSVPAGAGFVGAGPLGAGPLGAGPLGAGPLGAGPLGAGPLGAGPLGAGPLGAGSLGAGPPGAGFLACGLADAEQPDSEPPASGRVNCQIAVHHSLGSPTPPTTATTSAPATSSRTAASCDLRSRAAAASTGGVGVAGTGPRCQGAKRAPRSAAPAAPAAAAIASNASRRRRSSARSALPLAISFSRCWSRCRLRRTAAPPPERFAPGSPFTRPRGASSTF